MYKMSPLAALTMLVVVAAAPAGAAEEYGIDPAHSSVSFKISHMGLSYIHGRFNDISGSFTLDQDPASCSFSMTLKADSIDTANQKRDEHLKGPDFFNAKQFPTITFKSTSIKPIKDGYAVTGDLTMHGATKAVSFSLVGGRKVEFPKGVTRTGYSTDLILKRSDFGIDKFAQMLGEDVHISIGFEGTHR